jgi:NAD(P)H-dependent FMN reductase
VDLKDLPLPVYDGDLEAAEGLPANALKLKELMMNHDGFLISAPEYNSSISAALKNAIDWASRPLPGEGMLACFKGKVAGIMSASPGALGGLRCLSHVRDILENIYVMVIPEQTAVAKAHEAFDADGQLLDKKQQQSIEQIGAKTVQLAKALKAAKG